MRCLCIVIRYKKERGMSRTRHSTTARRSTSIAGNASEKGAAVVARLTLVLIALLFLCAAILGHAAQASTVADGSEHHRHVAPDAVRSLADYSVPRIALVREDGKNVVLSNEIDDGKPVVLSFVYTTCTTVCPLTSMTLARLQAELGDARDRVHVVSISIDPEQDTPARLREYALKFGAGPEWHHYTGTVGASVASQRAFDVYHGDKMSHSPVMLLRTRPNARWVRFEGFATADQLLAELRPVVGVQ
jgi:protein SCO1/2